MQAVGRVLRWHPEREQEMNGFSTGKWPRGFLLRADIHAGGSCRQSKAAVRKDNVTE
jgi:hypothetical protein